MTPPSSGTQAEGSARPKVLRRPAHFSHSPSPTPLAHATPIPQPIERDPAPTIARTWQDDVSFAVVLLVVVVLTNLAVMAWLSHIPVTAKPTAVASLPLSPTTPPSREVTVFAHPAAHPSLTSLEFVDTPTTDEDVPNDPPVHVLNGRTDESDQ